MGLENRTTIAQQEGEREGHVPPQLPPRRRAGLTQPREGGTRPLPSPQRRLRRAGTAGPAGPRARRTVELASRSSGEPVPVHGPRAGRRGAGRTPGRRTPAAVRRARGGRSDRPAGERERRARPPSAPHGDGPAWRRPGRAGHVPLPSPSEGPRAPRARGERTGSGPTGPGCVAARRGPRAGARPPGGGAARSWNGAEMGRPEKARRARRTGPARVSAEGPAKQQGGAGVLARHVANRAESKACKSGQGS